MVLSFIQRENKTKYLNQTTTTYLKAYNTIYNQYKELSEVIFTGFLNLAKIDEKLDGIERKTEKEKEKIRQQLFLQTFKRFNSLKSKHILSVNYILPDNTIFLKMINPLDYGQKFSNKRETLKKLQKVRKAIDSYEIGKNGSGFRYLYPIVRYGKYLGAVSITFSELAITSSIMEQYDVLSKMVLKDKSFDKEFLKNSKRYEASPFKGFLLDKNVVKELEKVREDKLLHVKSDKTILKRIYAQGLEKNAQSLFLENVDIIVTTIPVMNKIIQDQEAFIIILSKGEAIGLLNSNYFTILALFVFLYLAIILLFLQQKIKTLVEKDTMKQMMKKDKQILEQAKMAQMGEMIGNIAHQWRQPLSAISTLASGIKINHEYKLLKEEDIPKSMDLIVQNTKYLSETIDTFRDFIKEDKVEKEVLIQEKIDESLKIVSASIENAHIKLIKEVDYDNPTLIKMRSEEFSQVLINLINNSKDAIVQNDIEDSWIKITQRTESNNLIVTVEDNAQGIEESIITKVFDPYFTTKHQFQGTGLGLYMSKTIIEKHLKGKLEVENSEHGALFTITLKVKKRDID